MTQDQISSIVSAKMNYDAARKRNMGVNVCKDRLKNVLFNACPDLIPLIRGERVNIANEQKDAEITKLNHKIKELEMSVESLQKSLDDSDDENNELRKQIKELKEIKDNKELNNSKPKARRSSKLSQAVDFDVF